MRHPNDSQKRLAKSVIEYVFQLSPDKWKNPSQEEVAHYVFVVEQQIKCNEVMFCRATEKYVRLQDWFRTITDNGAVIVLAKSNCSRGDGERWEHWFICVDDDLIAEYERNSFASDTGYFGYEAVEFLYEHVWSEISRRREKANKPLREAQELEQERKQAEQEALESKRANDILRRL